MIFNHICIKDLLNMDILKNLLFVCYVKNKKKNSDVNIFLHFCFQNDFGSNGLANLQLIEIRNH